MKRRVLLVMIILCAACTLFGAINPPAATVKLTRTEVITTEELNGEVAEIQGLLRANNQDPTQVSEAQVLNTMINDELFRQGAQRDGVVITSAMIDQGYQQLVLPYIQAGADESQVTQMVTQTFGSVEECRKQISEQLLVQQYLLLKKKDMLTQPVSVSDSEINSLFRQTRNQLVSPENVKLSHIFIPFSENSGENEKNKETMDQVARKIKSNSMSFEAAVSQYSQDTDSKNKAGDIGWLTIDNVNAKAGLGENFFTAAFSTPVGMTSDVIVSLEGYHIIKVLAHNDAKLLSLDDRLGPDTDLTVKDLLRREVENAKQQQNYQRAVTEIIQDLRAQATVKVMLK